MPMIHRGRPILGINIEVPSTLGRARRLLWRLTRRRIRLSTTPGVTPAAAVILALCLVSCAANPDPRRPSIAESTSEGDSVGDENLARPPFYRIAGGAGATLLLMGTIHIGPDEGWTFSRALRSGLDRADSFVLEVDPNQISEDAIGSALARMVIIDPPRLLQDLVSPETAKILDERDQQLAEMGLPFHARKRLKPWYIAIGLVEFSTKSSGWTATASAESVILAATRDRPIHGLETFQEQLDLLDNLDPSLQDMMLRDTLTRLDEAVEEVHAHAQAWRRGEESYFEALAREGVEEMPEFEDFYAVLLGDRNRRWLPEFHRFLNDPVRRDEVIFVGVGTLHFVGEDGLIELFRKSGYEVRAIDHSEVGDWARR